MIKINFPRVGVDGISRTEEQILTWFSLSITGDKYEGVDNRIIADLKNRYSHPSDNIDRVLEINDEKVVVDFLLKIKKELSLIIKMPPNKIEDFRIKCGVKLSEVIDLDAKNFDNKGTVVSEKFGKVILDCLRYSTYRNSLLLKLADFLNIRTCPYCNAAYTLYIEGDERKYEENNGFTEDKKKRAMFQFDHYFPKEKYPIFSISFYNLIPSCSCCNLKKSKTDIKYPLKFHPYLGSIADSFHFKMNEGSSLSFWKGKIPEKFDLEMIANESVNQTSIDMYNHQYNIVLQYDRFTYEVYELYKHEYSYKHYQSILSNMDDENLRSFFIVKENWEPIERTPLSKLKNDIKKQLKDDCVL